MAAAPRRSPARTGAAQPPLLPPNELTKLTDAPAARRVAVEPEALQPESAPPVPLEERRARRRAAR